MDLKLEINTENNFSTICGANNSGKTNVLKALNIFFSPSEYDLKADVPNHKLGSRGGATYPEIVLTFEKNNIEYVIKREFGVDGLENEQIDNIRFVDGKPEKTTQELKEIPKVLNQIAFFLHSCN